MLALLVLAAAPGAGAAQVEASMAHPRKTLEILSPAEVDPALLAPPPADGSAVQKAELVDVESADNTRRARSLQEASSMQRHA
jgi:hypothetical protein